MKFKTLTLLLVVAICSIAVVSAALLDNLTYYNKFSGNTNDSVNNVDHTYYDIKQMSAGYDFSWVGNGTDISGNLRNLYSPNGTTPNQNNTLMFYLDFDNPAGNNTDRTSGITPRSGSGTNLSNRSGSECKVGSCYYFNGATPASYVNQLNYSNTNPGFSNMFSDNFTFCYWVKYNTAAGKRIDFQVSFGKWDAVHGPLMYIAGTPTPKPWRWEAIGTTGTFSNNTGATVAVENWHYVCMVKNGTNHTVYNDNALYKSGILTTGSMAANADLSIGGYYNTGFALQGWMDEIGIWNRSLSVTELTSIYNGGTGTNFSNTVGYSYSIIANQIPIFNSSGATFDGVDDILISPLSNITLNTSGFTLSATVFQYDVMSASQEYIIAYENSSDGFLLRSSFGQLQFYASSNGNERVTYNISGNANQWHTYTGTNDGTTSYLFIDGVFVNSIPATISPRVDSNLTVGNYIGQGQAINGTIKNAYFWNKSMIPNIINYSYCYQEAANVSTSCGGLSTGNYNISSMSDGFVDNNYSSTCPGVGNITYNYTIPQNASHGNIIVSIGSYFLINSSVRGNINYTIPYNIPEDIVQFRFIVTNSGTPSFIIDNVVQVYISSLSSWYTLATKAYSGISSPINRWCFNEEEMWWSMQVNPNSSDVPALYNQYSNATGLSSNPNTAMSFNGNSVLTTRYKPASNATFTYSAWIKPSTFTKDYHTIINAYNSSDVNYGNYFFVRYDSLQAYTDNSNCYLTYNLTTAGLSQNTWMHVAYSFNGTNASMYVNGVTVANTNCTNGNTGGSLDVGGLFDIPVYPQANNFNLGFDGIIDEVVIYTRPLSSFEVKQLFNMYDYTNLSIVNGTSGTFRTNFLFNLTLSNFTPNSGTCVFNVNDSGLSCANASIGTNLAQSVCTFSSYAEKTYSVTDYCLVNYTWNNGTNAIINDSNSYQINYFNIAPLVNITAPNNNSNQNNVNLPINYSIVFNNTADKIWWTNNSGVTNNSINNNGSITGQTWPQGNNTITVYANDTTSVSGYGSVTFSLDSISPTINISYPTSDGQSFNVNINLTIQVSDTHLSNAWWSNNSGVTNNSLTITNGYANITGQSWPLGLLNTITVYANDTYGNVNSAIRTFYYSTIPTIIISYPSNNSVSFVNNIPINYSISTVGTIDSIWWTKDGGVTNTSIAINSICYQETANVSTVCGGLSTGTYIQANNYFYVNYTKPLGVANANWQVKHGTLSVYNITLPNSCFNLNIIRLRIYSNFQLGSPFNGQSHPECYNGSAWNVIGTEDNFNETSSSWGSAGTFYKIYDGDWSTGSAFAPNSWLDPNAGAPFHAVIYEEAIWWNISILNGSITGQNWSSGLNTVTIYANDTTSQLGSSNVNFDIHSPTTINITFPASDGLAYTYMINITGTINNITGTINDINTNGVWWTNGNGTNNTLSYYNLTNTSFEFNISGQTWSQGNNTITVYANDTFGFINFTSRTFYIDSLSPVINITYPINNQNYNNVNLVINYTITETNLNSVWWTRDGGVTNYSRLEYCYQETANVSTACGGLNTGVYRIQSVTNFLFYVNYTRPVNATINSLWQVKHGALGTYNRTIPSDCWNATLQFKIYSQSASPSQSNIQCFNYTSSAWIILNSSTGGAVDNTAGSLSNTSLYDGDWSTYDIYSNVNGQWQAESSAVMEHRVYEEAMWWNVNTMLSPITGQTWSQGSNTVTIYANDTVGNQNSSTVQFNIDTINPNITIIFPINGLSYNTMVPINYTVSDINLETCKWTNNSGITNTTLVNCTNITGQTWAQGWNTVTVYVNDTYGNTNSTVVFYYIDTIYPSINITYPINNQNYININLPINYTIVDTNLYSAWWTKNGGVTNNSIGYISCYQESANISNQTGIDNCTSLIYTGNYVVDGSWYPTSGADKTYDGNWNTIGYANVNASAIVYVNYTKPNNAISAIWKLKENGPGISYSNIPNTCFNYNTNKISLSYVSNSTSNSWSWYCLNSSGWNLLNLLGGTALSEEAIIWSIPSNSITNQTWSQGFNTVSIYANDTYGQTSSSSVTFSIDSIAPNVNITYPPTNGINYSTQIDVITNFSDINLANAWWTRNSGATNNTITTVTYCYQEDPAESNQTGIDTCSNAYYNGTHDGNTNKYLTSEYYKPIGVTTAIWMVKHGGAGGSSGTPVAYNITIPKDCFEQGDFLKLRIYSHMDVGTPGVYSWSYPACFDGSSWVNIGTLSNGTNTTSIIGGAAAFNRPRDGLWNSAAMQLESGGGTDWNRCWEFNENEACSYANVYEEAIYWGVGINNYNISGQTWNQGINNVTVYANDSYGNLNFSMRSFLIDTLGPEIDINFPINGSSYNTMVPINYTVSDTTLANCWWTDDNGATNHSIIGCGNITNQTWDQGWNTVIVYVNDSFGRTNSSVTFYFIDTINPMISIVYPTNATWYNSNTINVNYTVNDTNSVSCKWSNNSGVTNTTLANCDTNITGQTWPQGTNNVIVYISDNLTNSNSSTVTFYVDSIYPTLNVTYPTSDGQSFNSMINVNATIIDTNLNSIWWTRNGGATNTTIQNWCYQESANISNQSGTDNCPGLNYGGIYSNNSLWTNAALLYDGNYSSSSSYTADAAELDIVYQKPLGALNTSLWQMKDNSIGPNGGNYSIYSPCWTYSSTNITFRMLINTGNAGVRWQCKYSSSDWANIRWGSSTIPPYEEGMWWNINTSITNQTWSQGSNIVTIYANDIVNNVNSTTRTFNIDTINPSITIDYPINGNWYNSNTVNVNYTASDANAISCKWTNTSGATNNTLANCNTNIVGQTWPQGLNTITVYINDSFGNINSSTVTFYVDSIYPTLTITYPTSDGQSFNSMINVNATITDINLNSVWWTRNGGTTNTSLGNNSSITISGQTWAQGLSTVTIYANDTVNNVNSTTRTFNIDTINPSITIDYPINGNWYNSNTININYTATDANTISCKWTNTSGATNNTLANCNTNIVGQTWPQGLNTITVYINDSFGNINSSTVSFYVDSIYPTIIIIDPASDGQSFNSHIIVTAQATDTNINQVWWTKDGGATNNTLSPASLATYCYQESANVSTSCGGLNTGAYACKTIFGSGWDNTYPCANTYDGNYGTYGAANASGTDSYAQMLVNYTIPSYISGAYVQTKIASNITNITLSAGCLAGSKLQLKIDSNYNLSTGLRGNLSCYNYSSSAWSTLSSSLSLFYFYEEGIWWTYSSNINITGQTWSQGTNSVTIYVNDTVNNVNSSIRSFIIDTMNPSLVLNSPSNGSLNRNNINITYTVSDTTALSCKWTNNSGAINTTLAGCSNITGQTWPNGMNTVTVYASDIFSQSNQSTVTFEVDSVAPAISITYPTNGSQFNTQIDVNYSVTDLHLSSCWWSLDGGSNVTLPGCVNITGQTWSIGYHNVTVYANDTMGNANSSRVTFIVDVNVPEVTLLNWTPGQIKAYNNVTGQFLFADDFALYSWNVSIDGTSIASATAVPYNSYIYNLSINPRNYAPGTHNLSIKIADGHTAEKIEKYNVKKGGLFDDSDIQFTTTSNNIVDIQLMDKKDNDVWSYTKEYDRYSFKVKLSNENRQDTNPIKKTKTIGKGKDKKTEEKDYVQIKFKAKFKDKPYIYQRADSSLNKWIVSGDNWVDFNSPSLDASNIEIYEDLSDRTGHTMIIEVYHEGLLAPGAEIQFNSIGDLNIVYYNSTFYTVGYNVSYNTISPENTLNPIILTINSTGTPLVYADSYANLTYNGVQYAPSKTTNGIYFTLFSKTVTAPITTTNIVVPLYWNISIAGDRFILSFNQSVYPLKISDNCSQVNYTKALSICTHPEVTPGTNISNVSLNLHIDVLDPSDRSQVIKGFGFTYTTGNCYDVCISPVTTTYYIDSKMEFTASGYSARKYYLENYSLDNITDVLDLYLLDSNLTTDVIYTVYYENTGVRIPDAYVKVLRYYPGLDNTSSAGYRTVEVERTDTLGQTLGKMVIADVWYKFIIELPMGNILSDTKIEKIITTDKKLPIRQTTSTLDNYNSLYGVTSTTAGALCDWEGTRTCSFTWSNPTGIPITGILRISQDTGMRKIIYHEERLSSSTATIAYIIPENLTGKIWIAEGLIEK